MKKMKKFDDVLNECIERVLRGESIEACLKTFPDYASELEPLLRTAVDTRRAASILPSPEFRQRAGYEFQAAVRDLKPHRGGFLRWHLRLVTALSVIVVVLLAGGGTVAAASNSLPDQSLYGVKLFTEQVRLALTPSTLGKAELHTEYTDKRVAEIIQMADKGNVKQVVKTTKRMNDNLVAIAKLIQPEGAADEAGEGPPQLMSAAQGAAPAPASATDESSTAAAAPNAAFKAVPAPVAPERSVTSNMSRPEVAATPSAEAAAGGKNDLKSTVSRQAEKNEHDLQEVLKRAPDSVKPALEQAIEVAGKGYEEVLKDKESKDK
jgi:hypothetical protein